MRKVLTGGAGATDTPEDDATTEVRGALAAAYRNRNWHDNDDNDNNGFRVVVAREHADREVTVQAPSRGRLLVAPASPGPARSRRHLAERPGWPFFFLVPSERRCGGSLTSSSR